MWHQCSYCNSAAIIGSVLEWALYQLHELHLASISFLFCWCVLAFVGFEVSVIQLTVLSVFDDLTGSSTTSARQATRSFVYSITDVQHNR